MNFTHYILSIVHVLEVRFLKLQSTITTTSFGTSLCTIYFTVCIGPSYQSYQSLQRTEAEPMSVAIDDCKKILKVSIFFSFLEFYIFYDFLIVGRRLKSGW
jgi:hypothetical protein